MREPDIVLNFEKFHMEIHLISYFPFQSIVIHKVLLRVLVEVLPVTVTISKSF
jgi:hypothetical protein